MIKATVRYDGRRTLFLGLSFGNLERFRLEPGDTYIHVHGKEVDLPFDVMLFSGATEADCLETLKQGLGPKTTVHIDKKMKQ
jgi:hypothetical protein